MARWFSVFSALLLGAVALAQARTEAVAKAISDYVAQHKIVGASVAIVKELESHGFAVGLADREKGVGVNQDTLFRLGSISKPVTAVAALQLVQEGKLSLDAPMKDFRVLR